MSPGRIVICNTAKMATVKPTYIISFGIRCKILALNINPSTNAIVKKTKNLKFSMVPATADLKSEALVATSNKCSAE